MRKQLIPNKNIVSLLLYIVCVCVFYGCSHTENDYKKIADIVNDDISLNTVKYIVVIPQEGCGGCITTAEEFYNNHIDNKDIVFVLTNVMSMKAIKHRLNFDASNTIIDINNEIADLLPENQQIYPAVITLQNGIATDIHFQSPDEDALLDLDNQLEDY